MMNSEFIDKLKSGDEAAFRQCVTTYQEKVRNTCFHFVQHAMDAEDIAQEVFVEVFDSIKKFREDAQLSTWIYRIAVNKSLDFIRRKNRKKRFARVISLFGQDENPINIPAVGNPQQNMETNERRKLLHWAVSRLPENQQTAITLSKFEELSNREVAEIMGLSLSATEALLHRAKKNLHKKLFHYFEKKI
jgi:RNA polymerase sigma-70 factor (ECF subfamily)